MFLGHKQSQACASASRPLAEGLILIGVLKIEKKEEKNRCLPTLKYLCCSYDLV